MSNNLVCLFAGGHFKSLVEVIELEGKFNITGLLDDNKLGENVYGYPVTGDVQHLTDEYTRENNFAICLGHTRDNTLRKEIFNKLVNARMSIPNIISPKATLPRGIELGTGNQIMHNVYIGADTKIGNDNIINTGAIIEHDCKIGNHCHIAPGACVIGGISICDDVFIGSNCTVIDHIIQPGTYIGNPVRKL